MLIRLLFDEFEIGIVQDLNMEPIQLHLSSCGWIHAFRVLFSTLDITPTPPSSSSLLWYSPKCQEELGLSNIWKGEVAIFFVCRLLQGIKGKKGNLTFMVRSFSLRKPLRPFIGVFLAWSFNFVLRYPSTWQEDVLLMLGRDHLGKLDCSTTRILRYKKIA